jgi:hypothetical protein
VYVNRSGLRKHYDKEVEKRKGEEGGEREKKERR